MKKCKTTKPTTKKRTPTKNMSRITPKTRDQSTKRSVWLEDYLDAFSLRMKPVTQAFIDRLAKELIEWAVYDDTARVVTKFYIHRGIAPQTFYSWVKKHEVLGNAYALAKEAIGIRREEGALDRTFDASFVRYTMPLYSQDMKKLEEWRSSLREEKATQAPQVVVLDKVPTTSEVPEQPKD